MEKESGKPKESANEARSAFAVVFAWKHLKRTGLIALVVGSWLTAINQWDVIAAGPHDLKLIVKIVLNYATPFVVANFGLLSRQS